MHSILNILFYLSFIIPIVLTGTNDNKNIFRRSIKYLETTNEQVYIGKPSNSVVVEPEFLMPDGQRSGSVPTRRSNDVLLSNNITATLGHNALLPCSVRNIGSYKILWLRVKDGDVLAYDNMLITQDHRFSLIQNSISESNLFIKGVRLSDSGEYACQLNTETLKAKFVNLVILTAPEFSDIDNEENKYSQHALAKAISNNEKNFNANNNIQMHSSPKPINIIEGNQITLECKANGVPTPQIKWYVKYMSSDTLIEYKLNTSTITVRNVSRNQYDYFECEANNNVPPSVSKKFKINVLYMPEVQVSPNKVFISSPPTQVKINCSVNSYPASDIIWLYKNKKNSFHRRGAKKHRKHHLRLRPKRHEHLGHFIEEESEEAFVLENNLILNSELKYSIYLQAVNDTYKQSSIIIDIESEKDYGMYACYANNSAGSKSQRFYIYGDRKHARINSEMVTNPKLYYSNYNSQIKTSFPNKSVFTNENVYSIKTTSPKNSFISVKNTKKSGQKESMFDAVLQSGNNSSNWTALCFFNKNILLLIFTISSFVFNFIFL